MELSVAAIDSLPLRQAPTQSTGQPMASGGTALLYGDATLVAKEPVVPGRGFAQKGKRVMGKAKTSVAAVKLHLLRCCHPDVVS